MSVNSALWRSLADLPDAGRTVVVLRSAPHGRLTLTTYVHAPGIDFDASDMAWCYQRELFKSTIAPSRREDT